MFSFNERIRYSETDANLNLTIFAMLNYFQDAAIFESEAGGKVTMDYLGEHKLAWLLGSWQIVCERMPRFHEEVIITTAPYDFKGFMGYRNFTLTTKSGECLAKANSLWMLINIEEMKPVRPGKEILDAYEISPKLEMEYAPRKIEVIGEGTEEAHIIIRKFQIDSNHHVNNGEYVNMALEYLPKGKRILELRVEYKKAAYLHDEVVPIVHRQENRMQIQLNSISNENYAVLEFRYE